MSEGYHSSFVEYVVENYDDSTCILEIGAGLHSTKVFAEKYKVYSVESKQQFINAYHDNYIHVPLDLATQWYKPDVLHDALPDDYDLLILDGPEGLYRPPMVLPDKMVVRYGFYTISWPFIKKDVPIIVDDTNRPHQELKVVAALKGEGYEIDIREGFTVCTPSRKTEN